MTKVIILGLDGATWDVLTPLIDDGRLPNLSQIISSGYSGTLESTFPPITAPAWLSMATGQNPGKTGVYYFLNRDDPDSFEFETLGSEKFRGQSFWDVLASRNHKVGIFNYPMLYPPYETEGFIVSGMGSPNNETITYPEGLKNELDDVTSGYEIKVPYADPKYKDRPDELYDDLYRMLENREKAIEYLLDEKDPEVFFGVISVTDWIQHYFWRYYDSSHVLFEKGHEEKIPSLWERIDQTLGMVYELAEREGATLLLVSDHGFCPVNRTFYVNNWLEDRGFRKSKKKSKRQKIQTDYFPYLRRIGESIVSMLPQINDLAVALGKKIRGSPGENINWERSVAFAPNQNVTCGMIYMLSDDPADRQDVINGLESLDLDINVFLPHELYHGPKLELAPDILIEVENFECAVNPRFSIEDTYLQENPPVPARSGGHDQEGIFVLAGQGVKHGKEDAHLLDVAPTILFSCDCPIPDVMDGNVLRDAFSDKFLEEREERYDKLTDMVDIGTSKTSRKDTAEVEERLQDLGYI